MDAGHHVDATVFEQRLFFLLSGANHLSMTTTSRASLWKPIAGCLEAGSGLWTLVDVQQTCVQFGLSEPSRWERTPTLVRA